MGGPKSNAPKPNYKGMANRLATWQHEDAQWETDRLKEAANIHNREMSRAKSRYAASGGSKDKIADIEAEHKRRWEETETGIKKQAKEKKQTLRSGATYKELFKQFSARQSVSIADQAMKIQKNVDKKNRGPVRIFDDGPTQKQDTTERDKFLKEQGATLSKVPTYYDSDATYRPPDRFRAEFKPGSEAISEQNFMNWTKKFGGFKTPEAAPEEDVEQIKTRKGEKPRAPLMANQLEQNPWLG